MATDTENKLPVINGALYKIGLPPAQHIGDVTWGGIELFEGVAKRVFRTFPWGFAQKYVNLDVSPSMKPAFGWEYGHSLPTGYLRVIDVHTVSDLRSHKCRYCIANGGLYTNVDPCYLRYVSYIEDASKWPVDFADAVSSLLAATLAPLNAQTQAMTPSLIQLYHLSLQQAQNSDATETTERVPMDEDIYMARMGARAQG